MAGKPNPSFEDIPPFRSLKRVRGDACPRRREDYMRGKHIHIYSLLNKSQGEPGDTDPDITLMPRSVVSVLDMKQVTGRADTLLSASNRCSCCIVVVDQAESIAYIVLQNCSSCKHVCLTCLALPFVFWKTHFCVL